MKQFVLAYVLIRIQISRFLFGHKKISLVAGPEFVVRRFHGTIHFCRFYRKPNERYPNYHIDHSVKCRFWEKTQVYVPEGYPTVVYTEGKSLWVWDILSKPRIKQISRFPEMPVPKMILEEYREAQIA